jgi:hypothetical protein
MQQIYGRVSLHILSCPARPARPARLARPARPARPACPARPHVKLTGKC